MTVFSSIELVAFLVASSVAAYFYLRTHRIEQVTRGLELREEAERRLLRFRPGPQTCEI